MTDRFGGVNPFAQPEPEAPAAPDRFNGVNPFRGFDTEGRPVPEYRPQQPGVLAREKDETDWSGSGAAKNAATGAIKGAAGTIGLPDVLWSLISPSNAYDRASTVYDYLHGPGAYERANPEIAKVYKRLGMVDAKSGLPTTEGVQREAFKRTGSYEPEGASGKIAQKGVEFATGAVLLPGAGGIVNKLKDAGVAAGAGAATSIAEQSEFTRDSAPAQIAAGLVGGIGTALAGRGLVAVKDKAADAVRSIREPRTVEGQRNIVARIMQEQAKDPEAAAVELAKADPFLPGSNRVTASATTDVGLKQLERTLRTDDLTYKGQVIERQRANDAARVAALDNVQPSGNPQAVRQFLAENLATLRRVYDDTAGIMEERARGANAALGPGAPAEAAGSRMREVLAGRYAAAKRMTSRLYRALEERNPELPVDTLKQGVADIYGRMPPESRMGLTNAERKFVSLVGGYDDTLGFQRLRALETQLNNALREARSAGDAPVINRLSRLRASLEDTYGAAVEGVAAREAQAVAAGTMRQEDTLGAFLARLKAEADDYLARTEAGYRLDLGPDGAVRARPVPAGNAPEIPGRPGDDGMAGPVSGGVFTADDRNALATARAARRRQGDTFERGAVGQALKGGEFAGTYTMREGMVPAQFFKAGPDGGARIEEFMRAAGPRGEGVLTDYAVEQMRNAAMRDGVIDPDKLAAWAKRHESALAKMPGLRDRFSSAATATAAMEEAAVARRIALESAQASLVGKILGLTDASADGIGTYVLTELKRPNGVDSMRDLMARISSDPDAVDGLRRTVLDKLMQTAGRAGVGEIEAVNAATFKGFLLKNEKALAEVFEPAQMQAMARVADDLADYQAWVGAAYVPGGPNTATDLVAAMNNRAMQRPLPTNLDAFLEGAGIGFGIAPSGGRLKTAVAMGASAAGANWLMRAMRKIKGDGMQRADDLLREAMLDPKLAAELLKRPLPVTAKVNRPLMEALSRQAVYPVAANQGRDE